VQQSAAALARAELLPHGIDNRAELGAARAKLP
jgi:hypothetical protein